MMDEGPRGEALGTDAAALELAQQAGWTVAPPLQDQGWRYPCAFRKLNARSPMGDLVALFTRGNGVWYCCLGGYETEHASIEHAMSWANELARELGGWG